MSRLHLITGMFLLGSLHSCLSTRGFQRTATAVGQSPLTINATYRNTGNITDLDQNFLSYMLRYTGKPFQKIDSLGGDSSVIEMKYDNNKRLDISVKLGDSTIYSAILRVKRKGQTLFTRRRLFIIPIPIIFWVYDERRMALYRDHNGNLTVNLRTAGVLWILMAAGDKTDQLQTFPCIP